MEDFKKTRVALYIRVSTDEQVTKGVSIEHQQESLIEYAKSQGYILNENRNIYVDKGYSGASRNRPALEKLMFDSQNNEFDLVLVKKVDRFFRKNLYLLQYVEELVQNGVGFKAVDQGFNIADSSGKMMLSMLGVIGEMERDLIRDRTISGKIQKAKMGYYVGGGNAKLGYKLEHDGKGNKLSVDEEESLLVKRIFNLFVEENKSLGEIANILTTEGIETNYDKVFKNKNTDYRKTKNHWYAGSLGKIIGDEMYIGNYYYGKKGRKFDKKLNKEIEFTKPKNEWLILQSPRIIDDVTFYKAQDLLKKNITIKNNKNPHVFAGLLKCDCCGRSYIGYKTSKKTISYRCGGYSPYKVSEERRCFNKQVSEKYLIDHIRGKLEQIFKNPTKTLEDYYNSNNQSNILETYVNEYNDIFKKIDKYTNGLKNLYKDIYLVESDIEREIKQETIKSMEKDLEFLNTRKIELNSYITKLKRVDENKENLYKIVNNYKKLVKKINEELKIELIKDFVEKVVVYESGRIIVFFKFIDNFGDDDFGGGNDGGKNFDNRPNINNIIVGNPYSTMEVNKSNGILGPTIMFFLNKKLKNLS